MRCSCFPSERFHRGSIFSSGCGCWFGGLQDLRCALPRSMCCFCGSQFGIRQPILGRRFSGSISEALRSCSPFVPLLVGAHWCRYSFGLWCTHYTGSGTNVVQYCWLCSVCPFLPIPLFVWLCRLLCTRSFAIEAALWRWMRGDLSLNSRHRVLLLLFNRFRWALLRFSIVTAL